MALDPRPPVTRLRPLHTHTYDSSQTQQDTGQVLQWTSSFRFQTDELSAIRAFLKVVARLVVLSPGEPYCVQDSSRGGYIETTATSAEAGEAGNDAPFKVVECAVADGIPTDFSIGSGKALQLHFHSPTGLFQLAAYASIVPLPALEAIGSMLEDLLQGLQKEQPSSTVWTRPSVLNFPPASAPAPIRPREPTDSHNPCIQARDYVINQQQPLLHHWFSQRAAEAPHVVALDYLLDLESGRSIQYTYQQVENASNALAKTLVHSYQRLESPSSLKAVAVLIGPCPEMYISYLAALKAGLAFCPIAQDTPKERQEALLADLDPVAILMASSSPTTSAAVSAAALIDTTPYLTCCDVRVEYPPTSPGLTATSGSAAYVLYTSGTTGMPKGVIISHAAAACTISSLSAHYGFDLLLPPPPRAPIRWFQGAAPTFDISIFEIFWTLSTGSTLCCAPRTLTLQNLDKVLVILKADITNITPSFASVLDPSSIRALMLGGESLTARLIQDFAPYNASPVSGESFKPTGIFNGYGPTEAAIYCIAQAHVPAGQRGSVIGTPLSTCGVLIVDATAQHRHQDMPLEPVPMGAVGELVITGPQVSSFGYLNRAAETASAFADHPEWGRVYKTGDRARIIWDDQGDPVVEFLGRISDDQVKLSGRRVELAEIDSVVEGNVAEIVEALSVVWKQPGRGAGSEKVVSLVVLDTLANPDFRLVETKCVDAARQHLPDYMRPFRILQVESLPRSASGKKSRAEGTAYVQKSLERLQVQQTEYPEADGVDSVRDPKEAELESELLEIASTLCGGKHSITATTSLADAGMDSLLAMRFLRDIRRHWPEVNVKSHSRLQPTLARLLDSKASIRSVFFSPSGGEKQVQARLKLSDFSSKHMPEALEKLNLTHKDVEHVLPTASTQSQLAMSFAMDSRNYISHSVMRLKAGIPPETLLHIVKSVVSEQPIYRSAFIPCEDSLSPFAQVVLSHEAWNRFTERSSRITHRKVYASDPKYGPDSWTDMAAANMSLETNTLYQIQIIEEEQGDSSRDSSGLLVISAAHCICDGASIELLLSDISSRFAGQQPAQRNGICDTVLDWVSGLDPATDRMWQTAFDRCEVEILGALSGNNTELVQSREAKDYGMAQYQSTLSWQELESKSRALSATPLTIIQAAWSVLISLVSEADTGDITFGSVVSGHHTSSHAPDFSVVPCRVALPSSQAVRDLLLLLVDKSRQAQTHRHTSFGIFKALPYNTVLALQAYTALDLDGSSEQAADAVPWMDVHNPAIRYDFAIFSEVLPRGRTEGLGFKITYHHDTLSPVSANCIASQFAALVETFLRASPDDLVQTLPARLPRALLSVEGAIPETCQSLGGDSLLLHSQFECQAAATPDLLALSFYTSLDQPPTEMSYGELDTRANGLATILRLENSSVVPICMQRSVELYVAVLAILKAGSAWCPIDETSPIQRRASLISRTQSNIVLTNKESLHLVEQCLSQGNLEGWRIIILDEYANHQTHVRPIPRSGTLSPGSLCGQDLAYLLWTSGTTGEPKGVMIQHSAASQAMRDLQIQVEHDDSMGQVRALQLSSYSFDVFVQDLFYTWGIAGCVVSGPRELVLGSFVEFVWKSQPTHAHLTPSFGASIAVDEIKGSALRYVTFIGEKLTEDVAEAWAAPEITTRAYNTYGPAENAVVSTMRRFHGKSRDLAKAANVGSPLSPCTAYVVRQVSTSQGEPGRWELVPRYAVGELALGGLQVGQGYLGNEMKTAKAFIKGARGIDERIYLTGDMVRLNDHGFEFLGRNDDLVKITGIRIELSEISAACATVKTEQPAIEHVETLYLPHPESSNDGQRKVIVTFVSVKNPDADMDKIRAQVFQRTRDMLPAYMIPGHVVVLNKSMPRTASNKVDRKALQEIYKSSDQNKLAEKGGHDSSDDKSLKASQWDGGQLPIVKLVAAHLNIMLDLVSPSDALAGLGLSSLQITKLAWYLKRELKCAIGVLRLMRCQLLGELIDAIADELRVSKNEVPAAALTSSQEENSETPWLTTIKDALTSKLTGPMRPHDTLYVVPATPMQESLLVETMLEPGAYWTHRVFDLGGLGEIDSQRLQRAWDQAAARFDILRSVFFPLTQFDVEGEESSISWARQHDIPCTMVQLVRGSAEVNWSLCSIQRLRAHAEKLQADLWPSKSMRPPWAVTFVESQRKLMLSMHHALYDGVSSEMLLDAVANLYMRPESCSLGDAMQFAQGLELGLLPTACQREEAASSWHGQLEELRQAAGPVNGPFPELTQSRQKHPQKIISCKKSIATWFVQQDARLPSLPILFQSAFGCILAAYMELKAVVIGQTVSQRIMHPDLAQVMGPAIATLPVIVRASSSSASELWASMSRDTAAFSHIIRHLCPVDLKRALNHGSDGSNTPLPGLFVYHPALDDEAAESPSLAKDMFREEGLALSLNVEHPLALNIFEKKMEIELTGDVRRISQGQLDLMLQQIIELAQVMTEFPHLTLDQLRYKLENSLVSLSGEATGTRPHINNPSDTVSIHARQSPDWIAAEEVIFEESSTFEDPIRTKTITYSQLDALANAIASRLAAHAAHLGPNDVVAMHMGRDIISLAVTLAIFRAGYVYLPVDDDMPQARKQLIIRDAKAKLVVTTANLMEELGLGAEGDPPVLAIQDGEDSINTILLWPHSPEQYQAREGGYLLYTSGSTGKPKGVRVSNSNLCRFIAAFTARLIESSPATAVLGNAGKYLNLTSRAFDPHLTQMFIPWHLGHRVVIGKDRKSMIANLAQVLNHSAITHFGSVPSVLTKMELKRGDVPSVRVITTGGEEASAELLDMWSGDKTDGTEEDVQDQVALFNFYGPTEVTIACLGHAVTHCSSPRNLGLPLQGLEALLLCSDANGEPVIAMRGQPGELCISGPQVAMGYLDRPEENEKSFRTIALPGLGSARRVYKTGDMMRMMHDGTLEFLGRIDQQAKIRGQRLEIGEVVSFLKEAAVGEGDLDFAAAVARNPYASNQQVLLGFVARGARSLLNRELQADAEVVYHMGQAERSLLQVVEKKCEKGLPAFMVPTLVWVSRIPYLEASGKVNTKQLAKLASDFLLSQEAGDERWKEATPSLERSLNAREVIVSRAVEEVVGRNITATARSPIAQLGIDSLSAVHLMSILRKRGFSGVTMSALLAPACTIGSLALSGEVDSSSFSNAGALDHTGPQNSQVLDVCHLGNLPPGLKGLQIEAVLPCLPLQAALVARSLSWASAANEHNDYSLHVPYVAQFQYLLPKETNLPRWKMAFQQAVASEAILRTCFVQRDEDGKIFQVVLHSPGFSLFEGQSATIDIVRQMNYLPPFRVELDEGSLRDQATVTLKMHHALFDGVGLGVLRRKVARFYNDRSIAAIPSPSLGMLKQLTACCQLSASQAESARLLWQAKLQRVQPCRVASVSQGKTSSSMARSTLRFQSSTTQLKAELQEHRRPSGAGVSLSCAFQLATALCLARITQRESVVYGSVLSLRPLLSYAVPDVDEFAGPCLNTLIQTARLQSSSQTLPQLAQAISDFHRDVCQGAMPFVPVETVQRWAGSEERLFDSLLSINVLTDADAAAAESPGVMYPVGTNSRSDMALAIDVDLHTDGRIELALSSNGALQEPQLRDMAQLFEKMACSAADPRALVRDFVPVYYAVPKAVALDGASAAEALAAESDSAGQSRHEAALGVDRALARFLQLQESEVLAKPRSTSLYQMGLDSITVLPFLKCLASDVGVKLTADSVIKARTIQGLVSLVLESKGKTSTGFNGIDKQQNSVERKPAQRGSDHRDSYDTTLERLAKGLLFVATPLQEGMLSASFAIAKEAYTYVHTIQLSESALERDSPSLDCFSAAVKDTVQACEILRTSFVFTQDDEAPWVGFVSPTKQSDLFRWEIVPGTPGRAQFTIHHALYDAASINSLWHILEEKYQGRLEGRLNADVEGTKTYVFRQFARMVASAQHLSEAFWTDVVRDYAYKPFDCPTNPLQAPSTFRFHLNEQSLMSLQNRCRRLNVTLKASLHLAWATVLCQSLYGQSDIIFGDTVSTAGSFDADQDASMLGPTINTVPMCVSLAQKGSASSVTEALALVQSMGDEIRGINSMASLRKIQSIWRSLAHGHHAMPPTLFQSLFVFDGFLSSSSTSQQLFRPVHAEAQDGVYEELDSGQSVYDEYPLIANFSIRDGVLCGKLRAKMSADEVAALGRALEAALRHIAVEDLEQPAVDVAKIKALGDKRSSADSMRKHDLERPRDTGGHTSMADVILDMVKTALGTQGKTSRIDYDTKLLSAGLDSILAIRLASALRKRLGINVNVVQIMKGATVREIVRHAEVNPQPTVQKQEQTPLVEVKSIKGLIAKIMNVSVNRISSVHPALPGQRVHLEQWLFHGKRFFEAPWVYRVADGIGKEDMTRCWNELVRVHEILRTTFVWTDKENGLFQVTLREGEDGGAAGFRCISSVAEPIKTVVDEHVGEENSKPSDMKEPPARLSFLEGSDGKAVVLRLHHALYDAWSIKLIESDLKEMLLSAGGSRPPSRAPLELVMKQIAEARQPDREDAYWTQHLAHAQETLLLSGSSGGGEAPQLTAKRRSHGPHSKGRYPSIVPQHTAEALSRGGTTSPSAAILVAFAKTLSHFTNRSSPVFGLNHASRVLLPCSGPGGGGGGGGGGGAQSGGLDLTATSLPTLTVTPFLLDLGRPATTVADLLDAAKTHLVQLSSFSQSSNVRRTCPRFNTFVNIMYVEHDDDDDNNYSEAGMQGEEKPNHYDALCRWRLGEPLASEYFTVAEPALSAASLVDGLDVSHLGPCQMFFHVTVCKDQSIGVSLSGDESLLCGDGDGAMAAAFAVRFGDELAKIAEQCNGD